MNTYEELADIEAATPHEPAPEESALQTSAVDEAAPAEGSATAQPPELSICVRALDGEPIVKLGVNVCWDGGELTAFTNAEGLLPPVKAPPGAVLTLAVQRFDKTYKEIGATVMPASNGLLTAISPSLVLETKTELHVGTPGTAEAVIPKSEASDAGDLMPTPPVIATGAAPEHAPSAPPARNADKAATPQATGKAAPAQSTKPVPVQAAPKPATAVPTAAHTATSAPRKISGADNTKQAPQAGRNERGHPIAFHTQKLIDWWGSWRLPTLNLWGESAVQGTAPKTRVAVNAEMVQQVQALLAFAKEQTEYDYTEGTAGVLTSMTNRTFKHKSGEKEAYDSTGLCYTYVKVALARSKIVDGILGDKKLDRQSAAEHYAMQDSASKAGPALLAKGFRDVTASVPDARWAAAGDVIVYEWTDETWARRKKKKKNDKLPNHGHIDIRDYEFYVSDFLTLPPNKPAHPRWAEYTNIRIYRKVFDPLPTQRIRAFLRCLRDFECQAELDDAKRYQMLNCAVPGTSARRFSSYRTHPWKGFPPPARPYSTAAGAYQILASTWQEKIDQGLISDTGDVFSPAIQDRIAVMKIEERNALHLIRMGKIKEAIEGTTLPKEWTSLPGGGENARRRTADGKPMNMTYLQSLFDQYLSEERIRWE